MRIWWTVCLVALACPAEAQAQAPKPQAPRTTQRPFVERGFVTVVVGAQLAPGELSEQVLFDANAETGRFTAEYGGTTGVVADGTMGFRVRRQLGIAVGVSRMTRSGPASVSAEIPHPFFDDRHRTVQGESGEITRTETAVHFQVYYDLRPRGAWRVRLFGGPSYFDVEQELVTRVNAVEIFPFDSAEFDSVTTERAGGTGIGFNGGLDAARMLTRRIGIGALIRYAGARIDVNAAAGRGVSTDGGGFQGAVGLRLLF